MKSGTYTMTLYKSELAVASQSVYVPQNAAVSSSITSTEWVSLQLSAFLSPNQALPAESELNHLANW